MSRARVSRPRSRVAHESRQGLVPAAGGEERGAAPPASADVRAAIAADRARLALPPAPLLEYRLAGPYPLELDGASIDEYVAWEV